VTAADAELVCDILVHGYDEVNLAIVEDVVRNRLDDLPALTQAIRDRLAARTERPAS
jgi:uncharacterized protein YutE (UPF0331/DUF86 family)